VRNDHGDEVGPGGHSGPPRRLEDVPLNGTDGRDQLVRDLRIRKSGSGEPDDFPLAGGESRGGRIVPQRGGVGPAFGSQGATGSPGASGT
jgi:hypothetical protein